LVHGIQDGSYGPNCIQDEIPEVFFMPGAKGLFGTADEGIIATKRLK
jgi:hypothetical protein